MASKILSRPIMGLPNPGDKRANPAKGGYTKISSSGKKHQDGLKGGRHAKLFSKQSY